MATLSQSPAHQRIPQGGYSYRIEKAIDRIEEKECNKPYRHIILLFKVVVNGREEDFWVHMYPSENPYSFYQKFVDRVCELCKIDGYNTYQLRGATGNLIIRYVYTNKGDFSQS